MPTYLIERNIPGAGGLSAPELAAIARQSCDVLEQLGPQIQWRQSFVTGDRITCVYDAPSEAYVREHARRGGFPADRIEEIAAIIDPTTASTVAGAGGGGLG